MLGIYITTIAFHCTLSIPLAFVIIIKSREDVEDLSKMSFIFHAVEWNVEIYDAIYVQGVSLLHVHYRHGKIESVKYLFMDHLTNLTSSLDSLAVSFPFFFDGNKSSEAKPCEISP